MSSALPDLSTLSSADLIRQRLVEIPTGLTDDDAYALLHDWSFWARPNQMLPPGDDWNIWYWDTGRGFGKTRGASECLRRWINDGTYTRINIVARTARDARDTMIEGESGILAVCAGDIGNIPTYNPAKLSITWPNGAKCLIFSAKEPDQLRGPQCEAWWADEVASWQYLEKTWHNLIFGARLGAHVRGIVTTTPRPLKFLKAIKERSTTVVTRGTTYDNEANLSPVAMQGYRDSYEGTRIGRQELYGETLEDVEGALWSRDIIENWRVNDKDAHEVAETLRRIVVAVDPSGSSGATGDAIGIVVAGVDAGGHGYILEDKTLLASPEKWASAAIDAFDRWGADKLIYEQNFGGDMVRAVIAAIDKTIPMKAVHASRGKKARAEPVVAKYEQGMVHHVGNLGKLEDEMCTWIDGESSWSPNRMDAAVWGLTELMLKKSASWGIM